MSDTIYSLWGREVRYAQGKFREQNENFIRTLARQEEATLLVTQDPYHSVVVAGEHRVPLPVFCELVEDLKVQDHPDGPYTTFYDEAVAFLRSHSVLKEEPRREVITERGALRAWGQTGGVLWHIWAGTVAPPYTHSVAIWVTGGSGVLYPSQNKTVRFDRGISDS